MRTNQAAAHHHDRACYCGLPWQVREHLSSLSQSLCTCVSKYIYTYYANRKSGAQPLSRPALQAVPGYVHASVSYTCMYVQLLQRRIPEPSSYPAQAAAVGPTQAPAAARSSHSLSASHARVTQRSYRRRSVSRKQHAYAERRSLSSRCMLLYERSR
jgi:hypothetical protein